VGWRVSFDLIAVKYTSGLATKLAPTIRILLTNPEFLVARSQCGQKIRVRWEQKQREQQRQAVESVMEVRGKICMLEWIWAGTMVTNTAGSGGNSCPLLLCLYPLLAPGKPTLRWYNPGALLKIKAEDVMIYGGDFTQWGETA